MLNLLIIFSLSFGIDDNEKMLNFKVLDMLTKADSILSYNVPHSMRNERLFAFKVPL